MVTVGVVLVVGFAVGGFVEEVRPLFLAGDHAVDGAPVGESTEVAVIDEQIGFQLAREMGVVAGGLLGVVTVGGVELHASLPAPLEGILQELTLTASPEHQAVVVLLQEFQGLNGEGALVAYLGVTVIDDRPVKINCNYHIIINLERKDAKTQRSLILILLNTDFIEHRGSETQSLFIHIHGGCRNLLFL